MIREWIDRNRVLTAFMAGALFVIAEAYALKLSQWEEQDRARLVALEGEADAQEDRKPLAQVRGKEKAAR